MNVWTLEWLTALRRRRVMLFSAGVPFLLIAALAFGRAPAPHAALVFTVLFSFFGTFGAAVPWARDTERGWLHRLVLGGVSMPSLVAQRLLAGALIDIVELMPALLLIAAVYRPGVAEIAQLAAAVAGGVLFANALGIVVATFARSLAETALLASVTALMLLHAAGVFRPPASGTFAEALQRIVPFHYMHRAIEQAVGSL